jgi:hypothetical protein
VGDGERGGDRQTSARHDCGHEAAVAATVVVPAPPAPSPPRATRRWWTLLATTPDPLGGENGGTSLHQPLSARWGCW